MFVAADAAARFPLDVALEVAASCFDMYGVALDWVGRFADAGRQIAHAHALHLRLPVSNNLMTHIVSACRLRFLCGHACKAAGMLRRALANENLVALATKQKCPWSGLGIC